ncbi:hypothetical protein [Bradyrhizobium sp. Cp5.3]|uniref:hypothetical protein n=1 Tax=Bradyrhizobium sp. Cp5.3 TaxID=443598 RepID=UPI0012EC3066|nr:hypothetical protein [Bradyrhizobium sp. Cp5.3]
MIRPDKLSETTDKQFVQLVIPGSLPDGQLAVLDFFLRHHTHPSALVVLIDDPWCAHSSVRAPGDVFPYWLYGDSNLRYFSHLLNRRTIELTARRIKIGRGWGTHNRHDGFADYEEIPRQEKHRPDETPRPASSPYGAPVSDTFPYRDELKAVTDQLAPDVGVVLVVPPNFHCLARTWHARSSGARGLQFRIPRSCRRSSA